MKKILSFAIILVIMLIVTACNSNGSGNTEYPTYKEALAANDFEAAHKMILEAESDYSVLGSEEFAKKHGFSKYNINEAKAEIFDKEVVFLATQGTPEANKRLLVLLNEEPMRGTARSEGQELAKGKSSSYTDIEDVNYYDKSYEEYINWCSKYNSRCMQILDIAISLDNKELASMMIRAIKLDPELTSKKVGQDKYGDDIYDIFAHYTSKTKDEAKAKFEQQFGKLENTDE